MLLKLIKLALRLAAIPVLLSLLALQLLGSVLLGLSRPSSRICWPACFCLEPSRGASFMRSRGWCGKQSALACSLLLRQALRHGC